MTAANWKTNEVQKPSLDSVCVCVCVCVDSDSNEVQNEGQSEGSALSRADGQKTNKTSACV